MRDLKALFFEDKANYESASYREYIFTKYQSVGHIDLIPVREVWYYSLVYSPEPRIIEQEAYVADSGKTVYLLRRDTNGKLSGARHFDSTSTSALYRVEHSVVNNSFFSLDRLSEEEVIKVFSDLQETRIKEAEELVNKRKAVKDKINSLEMESITYGG